MMRRILAGHPPPTKNKPILWLLSILLSCGLLSSCSHWRDSYLDSAVEDATQEQVEAKLGKPWRTRTSLLNGQTTWIYRYTLTPSDLDPMGINTLGRGVSSAANTAASMIGKGGSNLATDKPQCFHYLLTFHETNVLMDWIREPCADTKL